MGELIAGPDDETLEGVIRVEVRIEEDAVLGPALFRHPPLEGQGHVVEDVLDVEDLAEKPLGAFVDQRRNNGKKANP